MNKRKSTEYRIINFPLMLTKYEKTMIDEKVPLGQDLDKYIASAILEKITRDNARVSNLYTILDAVCYSYNVGVNDIKGKSRKREICMARHAYCYIAKCYTDESFNVIGKEIGKRDHATVVNSVNNMIDWVEKPYKGKKFWGFKDAKRQIKMFYDAKRAVTSILTKK